MEQQLFSQRLAELPVAPIVALSCQQCEGLRLILVGESAAAPELGQQLVASGAQIVAIFNADQFCDGEIAPDIAELLAAKLHYDAVLLFGTSELMLMERLSAYRTRLRLYRPAPDPREQQNLALLSDEVSRRVLTQQLYLLRHHCYLDSFSAEAGGQYTHPRVHAVPGEQILCIGPYLGKPFQAFALTSGGQFMAHCLEANPFTYAELCINLVSWGMHQQVRPVCAGAWSSTGMMAFASEGHTGGGNVLALDGHSALQAGEIDLAIFTYAVDDYVRESGFVPTLLESGRIGIATEVVKGAKETICRHKPKLILLDYPNTDAIALAKQWVPEYKVHYSECGRGSYGVFFLQV